MSKKEQRNGYLRRIAAALAGVMLIGSGITVQAETERAGFQDHIVEGLSPGNTKIDLFDYWLVEQGAADNVDPNNYLNRGINKDHYLKFSKTDYGNAKGIYGKADNPSINAWTARSIEGNGGPYAKVSTDSTEEISIVKKQLENGAPVMNEGLTYGGVEKTTEQSLSYLFDQNSAAGKAIYSDVKGLLQLDDNGYYYYDSQKNFAEFDQTSNAFTLYDAPGVISDKNYVADDQTGQFFPFDSAEEVFDEKKGKLVSSVSSINGNLNHYFGMHMTSYFMQPESGMTNDNKEMTFQFSGDDDVWVFIDGVLVGDVGGRHDRLTLDINFHDGSVTVKDGSSYGNVNGNGKVYIDTTIGDIFKNANVDQSMDETGKTFADHTYHTLDFFYLERGHGNSNLKLMTNLVSVPSSDIIKVDETGAALDGAKFTLYSSDENYQNKYEKDKIASGTTKNGVLTFIDSSNRVINFSEQYTKGKEYYILEETFVPEGYRKTNDIYLRYDPNTDTLISENKWQSGGASHGKLSVTVNSDEVTDGTKSYPITSNNQVFAVVMKREKNIGIAAPQDTDGWAAVSGNALDGYKLTPINSLAEIGEFTEGRYYFEKGADGKYQAHIPQLPGDVRKYYYLLSENEKANTKYSVGYYYEKENGDIVKLSSGEENFDRQFGTRIYITDPKNRLYVQKVDDEKNPVNGARFGLYKEADVQKDQETGAVAIPDNAKPFRTDETRNLMNEANCIKINGGGYFDLLPSGIYYLKELSAPSGYVVNDRITKVIVDENGVHADAGVENDGIVTKNGVGMIMESMSGYASYGEINRTLSDIIVTRRSGTENDGVLTWGDTSDEVLKLSYGNEDRPLQYGASVKGGKVRFEMDTGWSWMSVKQNFEDKDANVTEDLKDDIRDKDLTQLFSGSMVVQVENQRSASLEIGKTVEIPDGLTGPENWEKQEFSFKIQLTPPAGEELADSYKMKKIVKASDGTVIENELIGNVINGTITQTLKHGEKLQIFGLKPGTGYEVKEDTSGGPFKFNGAITVGGGTVDETEQSVTGTIPDPGEKAGAYFLNTYNPAPAVVKNQIKVRKAFGNWNLVEEDGFEIRLVGINQAPLPTPGDKQEAYKDGKENGIKVTVKDGEVVTFGEITYKIPGEYKYVIYEKTPKESAQIPGVNYSDALYTVTVTVVDNGTGALDATVKMVQTENDAGQATGIEVDSGEPAVITNTFSAEEAKVSLLGKKHYEENGKETNPKEGAFKFVIEENNHYGDGKDLPNPMPDGAADRKMTVTNAADGSISFGQITFTEDHVGNTYVYKITEAIPQETNGITYDRTEYYAHMTVGVVEDSDGKYIVTVSTVYKDGPRKESKVLDGITRAEFTNEYTVKPVENVVIKGQKTITGREWLDDESYQFTLEADDRAYVNSKDQKTTKDALSEDWVILDSDKTLETLSADTTKEGTNPVEFSFPEIAFTKAGTYTFTVKETIPQESNNGMVYDEHTATVKVEVTDVNGALNAVVSYHNNLAVTEADRNLNDRVGFTNRYETNLTYGGINVLKTMLGRELRTGEFAFTMSGTDCTKDVAGGTTKEEADAKLTASDQRFTNEAAAEGKADTMNVMTNVSFSQADAGKTYVYLVKEEIPNVETGGQPLNGVTYDRSEYQIAIQVLDDQKGTIHTITTVKQIVDEIGNSVADSKEFVYDSAQGEIAEVSFTNQYKASPVTVETSATAPLTKKLTGRNWTDADQFIFEVTAENGAPAPEQPQIIVTQKNAEKFGFGPIIFEKAGVYTYTVREVIPDSTVKQRADGTMVTYKDATEEEKREGGFVKDGITYSNTVATVKIQVEDYGNGELVAYVTVAYSENAKFFENVYTAAPTEAQLQARKELIGREWNENDPFTFELTAQEGVPMPDDAVENPENKTKTSHITVDASTPDHRAVFGKIAYTAMGDYTYTITEQIPEKPQTDLIYDSHVWTVVVSVVDNGQGALTVQNVSYDGDTSIPEATFYNVYSEQKKTVTDGNGMDLDQTLVQPGDILAYQIDWVNDAKDADGNYAAADITITDMIPSGTIYVDGSADGTGGVYDPASNTVTWSMPDKQPHESGTVSFQVRVDESAVDHSIENQATIQIGSNQPNVTNKVENFVPGKKVDVEEIEGDAEAQVGKILTYTISYKNVKDVPTDITITDIVPTGLDYVDGSAGEYAVYDADSQTLTWTLQAVKPGVKGTVSFQGKINESAVEKIENQATVQIGEDDPKVTNKVVTELPKDGSLAITKTVEVKPEQGTVIDETKEFTFTVTLKDAAAENAQSELTGTYDYTITNADGTPVVTAGKLKSGDTLLLKHGQKALIAGLPDGTGYIVTEAEIADDGYTANEQTVSGKINGDTSDGQSGIVTAAFTNVYDAAPAKVTIDATKKLTYFGQESEPGTLKENQFSFELSGDALSNPILASNDADGKITFADIPLKSVGTHTFILRETTGNIAGITYDPAEYIVTVEVTDDKNGMLTAGAPIYSRDGETADEIIFINDYHAQFGEPPVIHLYAGKELTGREMKAGEFSFLVTDENGTIVSRASNGADGTVVFPKFGFAEIGENPTPEQLQSLIGEHWYTITESGNDGNGLVYDRTVYKAKVIVTDNGDGTLAVSEPEYYAEDQVTKLDQIVFHNNYSAAPVNVTIQAGKILIGKDLTEGEFAFALCENDVEIARATNDAEGKIRFDLTYEDEAGEGEHSYTLAEIKGEDGTIVYDETVYDIQVHVADDGNGQLRATVIYPENGAVFLNKYEEPEVPPTPPTPDPDPKPDPDPTPDPDPDPNPNPDPKPDPTPDSDPTPDPDPTPDVPNPETPQGGDHPDTSNPGGPNDPNTPEASAPKTGDEANIIPVLLVMLAAAAVIVVVVVRGRKKK